MNQYITEKLNETELVYGINVWDIQQIAKEKIGRSLSFDEMNSVKKGIEWGFFDWDDVVKVAINESVKEGK